MPGAVLLAIRADNPFLRVSHRLDAIGRERLDLVAAPYALTAAVIANDQQALQILDVSLQMAGRTQPYLPVLLSYP